MTRIFLTIAAVLGGLAVAAGAFGAHALQGKLSDRALEIFDTASRYQMYHALALLLVALWLSQGQASTTFLLGAGYAFLVGMVLFCGSLYALSFSGIKWLGAIAPLGGVALMLGWGCLAIAAWVGK